MARRSRRHLLLLLLRYLVVALGYHKAYGLSAPKDHQPITAIEFEEAILSCKYPKKTLPSRLEWKKLGRTVSFVYYQQAFQGDFKDRAEMIDFSIRIKNVTRNDAGQYRCEVSIPSEQGQNLKEDVVTLEVLVAPAVPTCEVPNSALSGRVVELRCQEKEGNPAPEYTWFKNGIRLLENPKLGSHNTNSSYTINTKSGTLQFNPVSKLDSGEYSCEARNPVGHRRCPGKQMQVDDLNIGAIIAAVVVVVLVISICGLGVCYAQRKGYFSIENAQDDMQVDYEAPREKRESCLIANSQETQQNTFLECYSEKKPPSSPSTSPGKDPSYKNKQQQRRKNSYTSKATTMSENDFKHTKSFII